MICRAVLGSVEDSAADVDWVDVSWPQSLRRALRLTSRAGRRVDVLLPPGARLAHGDILWDGEGIVAVNIERIPVLAIDTADPIGGGKLAFHLGNLHLPAQITTDAIFTPDDGPARAAAELFGLTYTMRVERFYPEPLTLNEISNGPSEGLPMRPSESNRFRVSLAAVAVLACATVATAHPGHRESGFVSGLAHPIGGLDHVLAMIAVGVLAVALRRAWALPVVFVGMMVAGAAAGAGGWFVPSWMAESAIALSVVVFGLLMAFGTRVPAYVVVPLVALFAACHGSAHAAEMPDGGTIAAYFGGFVLTTIGLNAAGVGLGIAIGDTRRQVVVRSAGIAVSLCGALLLVGVL